MVEDVVDVRTELQSDAFVDCDRLVDSEIDAVGGRPDELVTLHYASLAEQVGADARQRERGCVPLIALWRLVVVANGHGAERRAVEVSHGIDRTGGDVAREDRVAVAAVPERCEASSGLDKHVCGALPSANEHVHPARGVGEEVLAASNRKIEDTVGDETVL